MLRLALRALLVVGVVGSASLASPLEAGVIPWMYNAIFGPVGHRSYYRGGYAAMPMEAYYAPSMAYASPMGGCDGCNTAMYAPVADGCCNPCNPCGDACVGGSCGNGPCALPPGSPAATGKEPTPIPDPNVDNPPRTRPRTGTDAPAYNRDRDDSLNRGAPTDGFRPRTFDRNDTPATGGARNRTAAPPTNPAEDSGYQRPERPRTGTGGTGTAAPEQDPEMFGTETERVPLPDNGEKVIPGRESSDEKSDSKTDDSDDMSDSPSLRLETRPTSGPVAQRERLLVRARFSTPSIVRASVRPKSDWTPGPVQLAKQP